jgi:endonuclease YncB( thermonuclease family)
MLAPLIFLCSVSHVIDGDTLICSSGQHVRLSSIDAPELHGCHGRRGRVCVPGDGQASRQALSGMALGKTLRCEKAGTSYRRVVAWCRVGGRDLSCALVRGGWAAYELRYDRELRLCRR